MERLATVDFVRNGQYLFLTGSSGTGKSFIAIALGCQACRAGIKTMYASSAKLMGHLKLAKAIGMKLLVNRPLQMPSWIV